MKDTQTGKAQVDFHKGRGFGPMGVGLPESFLEGDRQTVLATVAFLYTHPDPTRINTHGQAVAVLAAYAAGAAVYLSDEQFRLLTARVEEYESYMRGIERAGNEAFAAFVRAQAGEKHSMYGSYGGGKARLNFEDGRGFGPLGSELPDAFLRWDRSCVLATIAMLFTHPDPLRANKYGQAVAMMALYAAGAQVALTRQQYRRLEKTVREYGSYMRGIERLRNEEFARFARRHAERRAKDEGVI